MALRRKAACILRAGLFLVGVLCPSSVQAALPAPTKTWTGAADANWLNGANWTPVGAPGAADDVLVPAPPPIQPTLNGTATVRTLRVDSGATLRLGFTFTTALTITNDGGGTYTPAENAGTIVMESGPSRTVTLAVTTGELLNTTTGTVDVKTAGNRVIAASIDNQGTINLDNSAFFNKIGATYTNAGNLNLATGFTLTVDGGTETFVQSAGILDVDGTFNLAATTFDYDGGAINGTAADGGAGVIRLNNSALNLGAGGTDSARFVFINTLCTLSGNVAADVELQIGESISNTTLTAGVGFNSAGTIDMQSSSARNLVLAVTTGTFTNLATGTVNIKTAGNRTIAASLDNQGTINVDNNASFNKNGATYTSSGNLNVATGFTLTVDGATETFSQNGGTLDVDGTFNLLATTFNYNGGAIDGTAADGGLGLIRLNNSALNLGASGTDSARFLFINTLCTLSGNVAADVELQIGEAISNTTLTAAVGFTSAGTIDLQSSSARNIVLSVTAGTFVNTGTLNVKAAGNRTIAAAIDNQGTINVDSSTSLDKASATYTNNGSFNVAAGQTLVFAGLETFNQNGGTLDIQGTFDVSTQATFNYSGGAIDGTAADSGPGILRLNNGTLNLGASGTDPARFIFINTLCKLSGNVAPGIELQIGEFISNTTLTAAVGFTSAGTIDMQSSSARNIVLSVTSGTFVNTGTVNVKTAGNRTIAAAINNQGTINVDSSTSFDKVSSTYTNSGTIDVAAGQILTISGNTETFNHNGGTLQIDGTFNLVTTTMNYNGGAIDGTSADGGAGILRLNNSALNLGGGSDSARFIFINTLCTLSGNVAQDVELQIGEAIANTTLTAAVGFTSAGTIDLQSSSARSINFAVTAGTFTNLPTGTVNIKAAGVRTIAAAFDNQGTINVDANASFNKVNATYTNNGSLNIPAGVTLNVSGSTETFNQNGGTLDVDGTFTLVTTNFNYNGGMIDGTSADGGSGVLRLSNSALHLGAGGTDTTRFTFINTLCTLSGNVAPNVELQIGEAIANTTLTAAVGFTNAGTVELQSSSSRTITLAVASGTFTNLATGTVNVKTAGTRTIAAPIDNLGTINLLTNASFNGVSATYTNRGTINVPLGTTLSVSGSTDTLRNLVPGTITGEGLLFLSSTNFFGEGAISVDTQSTNSQFGIGSAVATTAVLDITGIPAMIGDTRSYSSSGFLNAINIELGGSDPGTGYDQLNVSGNAALDGQLNVSLINGFVPNLCQTFNVLNWGTTTGSFDSLNGLDLGGGLKLRPEFTATGLSLTAVSQGTNVNIHPTTVSVAEGGVTASYDVCLGGDPPTMPVTVIPAPDTQVTVAPAPVVFTPGLDEEDVKQVVVTAVDDFVLEGPHMGTIGHTSSSGDPLFNALVLPNVLANITDNEEPFSQGCENLLPTILVDSTFDQLIPGNGQCTLREAILNANADADLTAGDCFVGAGGDVVEIPAGIYTLTLPGAGEDANLTGDLDLTDPDGICLRGDSADTTFVQAGTASPVTPSTCTDCIDRVLHQHDPAADLIVLSLTLRHGMISTSNGFPRGGGLRAEDCDTLRLRDVAVSDNFVIDSADRSGSGGIDVSQCTVDIERSSFTNNRSEGANADFGGQGGGIGLFESAGRIENTTVSGNVASHQAGGIFASGNGTPGDIEVELVHMTLAGNQVLSVPTSGSGLGAGGLKSTDNGTVRLQSTIVLGNTDANGGMTSDDCAVDGGSIVSSDYNLVGAGTGCPSGGTSDLTSASPASELDLTLALNGGTTPNHLITPSSQALNHIPAGANDCGTTIVEDQRGVARPQSGNCEVGAVEGDLVAPPTCTILTAGGPDYHVLQGTSLDVVVRGDDADPGNLTLHVDSISGITAPPDVIGPSGTTMTIGNWSTATGGDHAVTVRVTDAEGLFDTCNFTVHVNDPPMCTPPAPMNNRVGINFVRSFTASDTGLGSGSGTLSAGFAFTSPAAGPIADGPEPGNTPSLSTASASTTAGAFDFNWIAHRNQSDTYNIEVTVSDNYVPSSAAGTVTCTSTFTLHPDTDLDGIPDSVFGTAVDPCPFNAEIPVPGPVPADSNACGCDEPITLDARRWYLLGLPCVSDTVLVSTPPPDLEEQVVALSSQDMLGGSHTLASLWDKVDALYPYASIDAADGTEDTWWAYLRDHTAGAYVLMTLADVIKSGGAHWLYLDDRDFPLFGEGPSSQVDPVAEEADSYNLAELKNPTGPATGASFPGEGLDVLLQASGAAPTGAPNMVGYPYNFPSCWRDIGFVNPSNVERSLSQAIADGAIANVFHKWNGAAHQALDAATPGVVGTLEPFDGIWVHAFEADWKIRFKPTPAPTMGVLTSCADVPLPLLFEPDPESALGGVEAEVEVVGDHADYESRGQIASEKDSGELRSLRAQPLGPAQPPIGPAHRERGFFIRLIASSSSGLTDPGNVLGQLPDSRRGLDEHDLWELPADVEPNLSLYFPSIGGEHDTRIYGSDFHAISYQEDHWLFVVSTSETEDEVTLTWESEDELKLFRSELVDQTTGEVIAVTPGGSYQFPASTGPRAFVWRVTP